MGWSLHCSVHLHEKKEGGLTELGFSAMGGICAKISAVDSSPDEITIDGNGFGDCFSMAHESYGKSQSIYKTMPLEETVEKQSREGFTFEFCASKHKRLIVPRIATQREICFTTMNKVPGRNEIKGSFLYKHTRPFPVCHPPAPTRLRFPFPKNGRCLSCATALLIVRRSLGEGSGRVRLAVPRRSPVPESTSSSSRWIEGAGGSNPLKLFLGPCVEAAAAAVSQLARRQGGGLRLNTDDHPQVATFHGIDRVPTVLLFKNGEKLKSITDEFSRGWDGVIED
ncbi:hypothetical protein BHM03_00023815 [Ensete ventricosum]|nr:hypothetical protein BHM03_00023815 [Ensete ventricosum]